MNYQRLFDISFIKENEYRSILSNAIDGINLACSVSIDAWKHLEQGLLFNDSRRLLCEADTVSITFFKHIETDNHTDISLHKVLSDLYSISTNFETWRISYETTQSILEESNDFWKRWKRTILVEYYKMARSKETLGYILHEFFHLKSSRNDAPYELEKEILDILGITYEEKIISLNAILETNVSIYIASYRDRLVKQKETYNSEISLIQDACRFLDLAIESGNLSAIHTALNPGWYSFEFISSESYKRAIKYINSH